MRIWAGKIIDSSLQSASLGGLKLVGKIVPSGYNRAVGGRKGTMKQRKRQRHRKTRLCMGRSRSRINCSCTFPRFRPSRPASVPELKAVYSPKGASEALLTAIVPKLRHKHSSCARRFGGRVNEVGESGAGSWRFED